MRNIQSSTSGNGGQGKSEIDKYDPPNLEGRSTKSGDYGKGWKTLGVYDGKYYNGFKNLCECSTLFRPVFSSIFNALYLIAGISDMTDGIVARKTNSASEFGSRFDSIADYIFVAVCLIILHLYIFIADGLQTVYELCFHFIF